MEDQAKDWEKEKDEEKSGSWIWDKSMVLGKRILVTGFVISTAPVVIPPLMVISALGLAASVPYGVFLAGYVCTEKLMSKLLPLATPREEKDGGEHVGFGDGYEDNEEEELKMRIDSDDTGNEEEKPLKAIVEIRSEEIGGKEEEEEEPLMGKNDDAEAEICGVMIEIEEGERTSGGVGEEEVLLEVTSVAVELSPGDDYENSEELIKETTGLIENLKDGGMVDDRAGEEKQSAEHVLGRTGEGVEKDDRIVEETVAQSGDKDADLAATKGEQNGYRTNRAVESAAAVKKENVSGKRGTRADEDGKSVARKVATVGGGAQSDDAALAEQNVHKDEKATAATYLYDDKIEAGTQSTVDVAPEGSNYTPPKNSDTSEVPASSTGNGSRNVVLCSEEKIWKQIDAVRKIVGYAAVRKATCIDELKALYVFTGVEPPASFKDPSDVMEVNGKLEFLMSVIGVK